MSSPDRRLRTFVRLAAVAAMGALCAGCFQPMYGDRVVGGPVGGESAMALSLSSVDVPEIETPKGTRIARVSVEVRNDLIFALSGGQSPTAPTHRLTISLSGAGAPVIVDISSGRTQIQNYNLYARYSLMDIATGKQVVVGNTNAAVSYDIPGTQQRFVGERGVRDAENRAAQVIAEHIRNRLASYFTAGT